MEPQSKRRARRSPPPPQHGPAGPDDRISALPDDMLLQVLVRLRSVRAAAQTGLISRRWRGLWARLPGLTFCDIPAGKIKSALAHVPRLTAVSLLEIRLVPSVDGKGDDALAKSLLRSVARISPEEIVFVLPHSHVIKRGLGVTMVLPCFHRATSIELDTRFLRITSAVGELPVLKTLSISGNIVNLAALLSRCPRLRVLGITFRGVQPGPLESELATLEATAAALGLTVSRLGIEFDSFDRRRDVDGAHLASLLHAAARICPRELLFTSHFFGHLDGADMLCFHRTTSIEMNFYSLCFTRLLPGEFSALERLVLDACTIADLVTMIIRCPRLRVLKVTTHKYSPKVMVFSGSLQELDLTVQSDTECESIHIVTPLLEQLKLNVHGYMDIAVSISAPMVGKVSWWRSYTSMPLIFGFWWLRTMRLETVENYKHKDEEAVFSQLPRVHVLSMEISSYNPLGVAVEFAHEMDRLLVISNFSVLELHLDAQGHGFGSLVLRLLQMPHMRTTTQKLKVILQGLYQMPQASKCVGHCPCGEPLDWRSQSILLTSLEEVEINNFTGGCDEMEFVRFIFECAPMLTRMIIWVAPGFKQSEIEECATTINNICSSSRRSISLDSHLLCCYPLKTSEDGTDQGGGEGSHHDRRQDQAESHGGRRRHLRFRIEESDEQAESLTALPYFIFSTIHFICSIHGFLFHRSINTPTSEFSLGRCMNNYR
uniref:Uncharacterized protein n=1 Tax=Avena sativa TaxID=4498 RepID=A0ACD5WI69_AVESA